jgi:CRP/FNR family cyclic AMP-dependent transcriptional regulator
LSSPNWTDCPFRGTILCMLQKPKARVLQSGAEKRKLLREHFLFAKLSPAQIDRLSACIITKSVKRSANIFSRGDPGSSLFAVRKGRVKISAPSIEGHDAVFNLIGKGEIFGEIALLDGGPRTANAIALTDCEFFVIERRDFVPLLSEEPAIALVLIEILCARLRRTTEQVEYVVFHNLSSRLAKALLRMAGSAADRRERRVDATQRDLGSMIGMSRESTNKQLRSWERKRWVRLERGGVVILAAEALESIAEGDFGRALGERGQAPY